MQSLIKLGHSGFILWYDDYFLPSHYVDQCLFFINNTWQIHRQSELCQISHDFIQEKTSDKWQYNLWYCCRLGFWGEINWCVLKVLSLFQPRLVVAVSALYQVSRDITVVSYEQWSIGYHQPIYCLGNWWFRCAVHYSKQSWLYITFPSQHWYWKGFDNFGFHWPFWITLSAQQRWLAITDSQRNLIENVCNFEVSNVPADGLAPLGARTSAGTLMSKFGSHIHLEPALEGLNVNNEFICVEKNTIIKVNP